jgi:hypothetical protein
MNVQQAMQKYTVLFRAFYNEIPPKYSNETTLLYFKFLKCNMTYHVGDFFGKSKIKYNSLHVNDQAMVIDGQDLDMNLLGHKETVSSSRNFRFFYLKRCLKSKPYYRLVQCRHQLRFEESDSDLNTT